MRGVPKSREKSISKPSSWAEQGLRRGAFATGERDSRSQVGSPAKGITSAGLFGTGPLQGGIIESSREVLLKESSLDGKILAEESSH